MPEHKPVDVAALRELCAKATPGTVAWADEGDHYSICIETDDGKHRCVASIPYRNANWQNDLNFYVAARTAIPALLYEIEALRKDKARLDWLEITPVTEYLNTRSSRSLVNSWNGESKYSSLREAIDAAIGSEKGTGK